MNKRICNTIKITVFLLLLICMAVKILKIFNYKSTGGGGGWQRFYEAKENSIDVIFFGNSHAHCTIDHGLLWEEYGMAGYTLSAGAQTIDSTCYFVKEALRNQKPKVIGVEVMGVLGGALSNAESDVYRNSLGMKWSPVFWEYADYLADSMEMDRTEKQRIFLKIPIIHSRYAELVKGDFQDAIPFMRGYRGSFDIETTERPEAVDETELMELDPQRLAKLQEIIDTADENGVPVVLFASPFKASRENQMQLNALAEFAQQKGIPFINFNRMYDELFDFESDFRDWEHVNNDGAAKATAYLAKYLKDNYEIPDRRGQEGYALWGENALYLRNKGLQNELKRAQNINEYLQKLMDLKEGQTVIIALVGNYNALGEVYLEELIQLGITREEYEKGGAFIFRGGEKTGCLTGKEYGYCLNMADGEIYLESAIYEGEEEMEEETHIYLDGNDYAIVENGVNIVVYNEDLHQVIDVAADDVYMGLEMTHCSVEED